MVGVLAVYLTVDLVAKLLNVDVNVAATHVVGGRLAISRLITMVWDGIVIGLAIGVAGIGLSMTYSILGFANFSHGDYISAGAFAGWAVTFLIAGFGTGDAGYLLLVGAGEGPSPQKLGITPLSTPLGVIAGLVVAAVATVGLALAIDRIVYRPMREQGAISLLIASIGVALVIRYLIVFVFGGSNRGLTAGAGEKLILAGVEGELALATKRSTIILANTGEVPPDAFYVELPLPRIGNYSNELVSITSPEVTLVLTSVVMMLGVHILLQRTKLGTSMRAMADNKDLARVTGIPTERVIRDTWIIGAGLAGGAGYLLALERGTLAFNLGWLLLLLIFAAVILGGIGSIYGAMAGGIVIGLVSKVSLVWVPSGLTTAAAFAIMIFVLVFRPSGLFGGVTTA